ncbi:MAG TPA: hypothetical protein PLI42_01740 [Candidatus Pacearchaeota archaeon]|nr:hypothetical protein [Candidatus Pacearchaeota archaeon]
MFSSKLLFKEKLNSLLKEDVNKEDYSMLDRVFILSFIFLKEKNPEVNIDDWHNTFIIFKKLGLDNFIELLSEISSSKILLPSEKDLQESLLITISYYYKVVRGYNWKKIKKVLNIPNFNTIKYGIKIQQLEEYINEKVKECSSQINKDNNNEIKEVTDGR